MTQEQKKTPDEVRQLVRVAMRQEEDFRTLMLGANCSNMAIKSEGASQAFGQVLGWLADMEA